MQAVPGGHALVAQTNIEERLLAEMTSDQLEGHRHSCFRQAARQDERWASCHIERACVSNKGFQTAFDLAELGHFLIRLRKRRDCRNDESIVFREELVDESAELMPPHEEGLKVRR